MILTVFCTDRGQHARKGICDVWRDPDGWHMSDAMKAWFPPDPNGGHGGAYRFFCPACPRDVQLRPDRWWQIVDGATRTGVSKLDLSYIE